MKKLLSLFCFVYLIASQEIIYITEGNFYGYAKKAVGIFYNSASNKYYPITLKGKKLYYIKLTFDYEQSTLKKVFEQYQTKFNRQQDHPKKSACL